MAQNFFYPPSGGGSSSNASVGANGITAPTSSTEVGFINGSGNLTPASPSNPLPVVSAAAADTTGSGTFTAAGQTVVISQAAGSSSWSLALTGTFSSGTNITWEVSDDGTNWIAVNGRQTGTGNGVAVIVNNANGPGPLTFRGNLAATQQFRARCVTYQAGDSVSVAIRASAGVGAVFLNSALPGGVNIIGKVGIDQTTPGTTNGVVVNSSALPTGAATAANQATEISSLSTIATNTTGVATAANQATQATAANQTAMNTNLSSLVTNSSDVYFTGPTPATQVINTNILTNPTSTNAIDLLGYHSISFQVNTGVSTTAVPISFEGSDDNVNFVTVAMYDKATPTAAPVSTMTTAPSAFRYFEGPVSFRYFRLRLTSAITAGTIQAFAKWSPTTYQMTNNSLAAGTQSIGSVTIASGTVTSVTTVGTITNPLPAGTNTIGGTTQAGSAGVATAPVMVTYSSTPITTSAYTQLVAAVGNAVNFIDIFDSSGQAMILATGTAGSEVILAYVPPGGDQIRVQIAGGIRIAYKALTANASSGYLLANFWR